jgi:hypothetical protein
MNSYPRHCIWVFRFTPRPPFPGTNWEGYWACPRSSARVFGEERRFFTSQVWNSLVTIPTKMSRNVDVYGRYAVRCVRGNKVTKYSVSRWYQWCSGWMSEQRVYRYSGWWVSVRRETWHKHVARGVLRERHVNFFFVPRTVKSADFLTS